MELVRTKDYASVVEKAREILRETAPVKIGNTMQPLCSDDAIDEEKLKYEKWYMNHLDENGRPTEKTDAFMCFGVLDFNELFYLNKSIEGVEDFQKNDFKDKVRSGVIHFALAQQGSDGKYLTEYTAAEKADPEWFDGFDKRYDRVCMLHWVAKKKNSSQPRLFGAAEKIMKEAGFRYIFLQVGCKDQSKLAAYYAYNGLTIVMLAEEKVRGRSKRKRQSVVIKANAQWGFVFWGWKDMFAGGKAKKLKL